MRFAHIADQRIRASDHDPATDTQHKQQNQNPAKSLRARQREQRHGDESQTQNQSEFFPFVIQQRTNSERRDDQSQRLRKRNCPVLP